MLDDATTGEATPVPRCMWCSAELPSESEAICPSCGATLIEDGERDRQVPGVTAIDAEAIIRGRSDPKPQRRNRLMSWISGDYPEEDQPAPPGSLAPPPPEVRREMLRLELEAEVAAKQAEVDAMAAERAVDAGVPVEIVEIDPATLVSDEDVAAVEAAVEKADAAEAAAAAEEAAAAEPAPEPEDVASAADEPVGATEPASADADTDTAAAKAD
jgi:predicted RNA-binding Zn-ribbon protein involved in translation (DUF1610 family)